MLIQYTGPKPSKTITWGGREYIFAPTCEIPEMDAADLIRWLLHADRAGLFIKTGDLRARVAAPAEAKPDVTPASSKPTARSGRKAKR